VLGAARGDLVVVADEEEGGVAPQSEFVED
jgi:hypothetical protein